MLTRPYFSVAELPAAIVHGAQENEAICGAPGSGVFVGFCVLPLETTMTVVRFEPNRAPFGPRNSQLPLKEPKAVGALITREISTTPPGAAAGTGTLPGASFAPPTKASAYELSQVQVPVLRTRQVLVKVAPGASTVPSGIVISATYCELGVQLPGAGVFVVEGKALTVLPATVIVSADDGVGDGMAVAMLVVPGRLAAVSVTEMVRPASAYAPEVL